MSNAERFLEQNGTYAETLTPDDLETVRAYAEHHSGGLYVVGREMDSGLYVKSHESWGGPDEMDRAHVVHIYDPEDENRVDVVQYYETGHEALEAFLTATDETETVRVLVSFEISGPHTARDVDTLLWQAVVQFEDPRDERQERVAFSTRIIGSEWETEHEQA